MRLFAEKGYDNVSVRSVAREAGVASGLAYHYFDSKQRLFDAAISHCAEECSERMRAALDKQAATYDGDAHGAHARTLYPHVAEEVVRAVAGMPVPHLLDLGCGTGSLSELILGRIPGGLITCFDLPPNMLIVARKRLEELAEFVLGDAEKLPFKDGSFDTA